MKDVVVATVDSGAQLLVTNLDNPSTTAGSRFRRHTASTATNRIKLNLKHNVLTKGYHNVSIESTNRAVLLEMFTRD